MSCFKLPLSICSEVEKIIRHFWWGSSTSERGLAWKSWSVLCSPKSEGGLGFRDLNLFNDALLAKQLWRFHTHPHSLLARSLKAKYFPSSSIWETNVGFNPSYAWRSMWGSRYLLEMGSRWRIGNGRDVKIWSDAWVSSEGTDKIISPIRVLEDNATVDMLIDQENLSWRLDVLQHVSFL